jgi:hypothetical protein
MQQSQRATACQLEVGDAIPDNPLPPETMTEQSPNIHALLIGIDHYEPNQLFPNLKGSVRDIELVETFLTRNLELPQERIQKLISRNREDETLMAIRSATGPEPQKPTYENIVNAFNTITETAQPGEQVYIHYSGHGGRAATVFPNLKQGTGTQYDEGLVPMDIGDSDQGRYLRDVEMTTLLKRMTDKGLIVTVILDSCHAGGATRGMDAQIRSSIEPDLKPRTAESLVASKDELEQNWLNLTRAQGVGAAGLPKARDYVLLAACRPNESAYEYPFSGDVEQPNGALTYWMMDTLNSVAINSRPLTYKLLHDRLNAQIQSQFPRQLPMIMGDSERLVFGSESWTTPYTAGVLEANVEQHQVSLNGGRAQGLSKGTRFAIYPLHTTDFTDQSKQVAVVEISELSGASKSDAKILTPEEGGISINGTIERGAPAVMVSAPIELVQRVRLFDGKVSGNSDDNELPENLVDCQTEALEKIRQALKSNGWVVEAQGDEAATYQVAIDREGNYEICRGLPIPNLRPLLSINDPSAPDKIVKRLVHLAKYQAVQSLDNAGSRLADNLKIELIPENGQPLSEPQNPVVQHNQEVTLRITNKGSYPLKISVMDLDPAWGVFQLPLDNQDYGAFFYLEKGTSAEQKFNMEVPDDEAYESSVEIIKVFAVREGLADFRWLELPALDEPPPKDRNAQLDESIRGMATRGLAQESLNPLNNLMEMIGADAENSPNVTRAMKPRYEPEQEWFTKQLRVRVEKS